MTIELPPDVELLLLAKVANGLFPSLDAAMTKAAYLLLDQIEPASSAPRPKQKAKKVGSPVRPSQPRTIDELHQQMLADGKISQLPDIAADFDDPDDLLVTIEGEPLSETIIRERR